MVFQPSGLEYTDLLGDGDSKDYNKVKAIFGVCQEYEKYTRWDDRRRFATKVKNFLQKHREKKAVCRSVNKTECISRVDERGWTALSDLRDSLRGTKLRDGKAVGEQKHRLTDKNIKKLQTNDDRAIRSNVAPNITTAKKHKNAVERCRR